MRAVIGCFLLLGGCVSAQPLPPPSPTVKQIAERAAEYRLARLNVTPLEYLQIGAAMTRDACLSYFDLLVQAQDKLLFAGRESALLGAVAMGAGAATGAGAAAMAGMALANMAVQGTIGNAEISSGAGLYPDETASLILDKAMPSYVTALPPPQTIPEADADVRGMAAQCSSSKIHQLVRGAIASAQTMAVMPAAPAQASVVAPPELPPEPTETPTPRPRKRHPAPHRHGGAVLTPPAGTPTRAYPPSLAQQWEDVRMHGRAAV